MYSKWETVQQFLTNQRDLNLKDTWLRFFVKYYHAVTFNRVLPNSVQVRKLACNYFLCVCFNTCFQTVTQRYLSIILCLHILHVVHPHQDTGLSLTCDSFLNLSSLFVDLSCMIVIWVPQSVLLIQNQWFSFILHTRFDLDDLNTKSCICINFLVKFTRRGYIKQNAWMCQPKLLFILCWFGRCKHWV